MLAINRLGPVSEKVEIGFECDRQDGIVRAIVSRLDSGEVVGRGEAPVGEGRVWVRRLLNDEDYEVTLVRIDPFGRVHEKCKPWRFRCGYVPGTPIAYRHPMDGAMNPTGRFLGTPSILKCSDGTLLASHDLFFWDPKGYYKDIDFSDQPIEAQRQTWVYRSEDGGRTWAFSAAIPGCMFGKLFEHRGRVYMYARVCEMAEDGARGHLGLYCSEDGGAHWSKPIIIAKALASGQEYHKSSTPVLISDGRLFTSYDSPLNGTTGRGFGVVSIPVDADLMDASAWTVTEPCYYSAAWADAVKGEWNYMMEEANLVQAPDGSMRIISRYNAVSYDSGIWYKEPVKATRAVMLRFDPKHPAEKPVFEKFVPFVGSMAKFVINFDAVTKRYYAVVNRITNNNRGQRMLMTLTSSADLYTWRVERDLINLEDAEWHENCGDASVSYFDALIDGEDLLVVSRTAMNGAISFHDNNYMTFHRIRNFRNNLNVDA